MTTFDLSTNESPLGPSPKVVEAIIREAGRLHRYPARDDLDLRERLALHHGRGLTPDHFFAASSGSTVLDLIARSTLEPGDEVIISSPTFVVYQVTTLNHRARVIDVPADSDTGRLDLDRIEAAIGPRTKLIYLCNPGNPTGVVTPAAAIDQLLARIPAGVVVVADEVYYQYVDEGELPDTIGHIHGGRDVVIIHSFSKAYGLAGLRLGYGIARPVLAKTLGRHRLTYDLSRLALVAGVAALDDQAHVSRTVAMTKDAKSVWYRAFDRFGLRYWHSSTNFVMVAPRSTEEAIAKLAKVGILVRPVEGPGQVLCLRISVGTEEANARVVAALEPQ